MSNYLLNRLATLGLQGAAAGTAGGAATSWHKHKKDTGSKFYDKNRLKETLVGTAAGAVTAPVAYPLLKSLLLNANLATDAAKNPKLKKILEDAYIRKSMEKVVAPIALTTGGVAANQFHKKSSSKVLNFLEGAIDLVEKNPKKSLALLGLPIGAAYGTVGGIIGNVPKDKSIIGADKKYPLSKEEKLKSTAIGATTGAITAPLTYMALKKLRGPLGNIDVTKYPRLYSALKHLTNAAPAYAVASSPIAAFAAGNSDFYKKSDVVINPASRSSLKENSRKKLAALSRADIISAGAGGVFGGLAGIAADKENPLKSGLVGLLAGAATAPLMTRGSVKLVDLMKQRYINKINNKSLVNPIESNVINLKDYKKKKHYVKIPGFKEKQPIEVGETIDTYEAIKDMIIPILAPQLAMFPGYIAAKQLGKKNNSSKKSTKEKLATIDPNMEKKSAFVTAEQVVNYLKRHAAEFTDVAGLGLLMYPTASYLAGKPMEAKAGAKMDAAGLATLMLPQLAKLRH